MWRLLTTAAIITLLAGCDNNKANDNDRDSGRVDDRTSRSDEPIGGTARSMDSNAAASGDRTGADRTGAGRTAPGAANRDDAAGAGGVSTNANSASSVGRGSGTGINTGPANANGNPNLGGEIGTAHNRNVNTGNRNAANRNDNMNGRGGNANLNGNRNGSNANLNGNRNLNGGNLNDNGRGGRAANDNAGNANVPGAPRNGNGDNLNANGPGASAGQRGSALAADERPAAADRAAGDRPAGRGEFAPLASPEVFLRDALSAGMMEVELGRVATRQAENDRVRQFGQRMVDDHSRGNQELMKAANSNKLDLPAEMSRHHKDMVARLEKLNGAEFDREYMKMMVQDHTQDVRKFEQQAEQATDPEVQRVARRLAPILRDHLRQATDIARDLGIRVDTAVDHAAHDSE